MRRGADAVTHVYGQVVKYSRSFGLQACVGQSSPNLEDRLNEAQLTIGKLDRLRKVAL
jgi:hypothetical protein